MSDAADLARRFLTLWEDYLAAVLADPAEPGLVQPWLGAALARAIASGAHESTAGEQAAEPGPPAGAAAVADPSGKRDQLVAELARRIADLEARIAAIEPRRRVSKPGNPDRRLAPRPLPIHLATAISVWLSSRAALPILKYVSPRSSVGGERVWRLAAEIEELGPDKVAAALDGEIIRRAGLYLSGLESYRRHPFRRRVAAPAVLWRSGATRLLDYGSDTAGAVVFVVPSLINRYYVLDILPERSFLRHLTGRGLRPLVVDWGAPGKREQTYGLSDYVTGPLDHALTAAARVAGGPIGVVGYCMGGLFALALALRRQDEIGCLALLATPWDFHAGSAQRAQMFADTAGCLLRSCGEHNMVPVEMIQSFFFMLDPFAAERKFTRFAALNPDGDEARSFVALEDWLNDGVPLSGRVAHECARFWYGENLPGRLQWRVGGQPIDPRRMRRPALVVLPRRDRIVPPGSAKPLAARLPAATVMRPPLGHVGMMSAARAPATLWTPIADWLRVQLGSPRS